MQKLEPALYPTIFTRRSVRRFAAQPLDASAIADTENFLQATIPLLPGQQAQFLLEPAKGGEHRIYAFCEQSDISLANVGFVLQQVDLYLQGKGIGSLWFGMGRRPADLAQDCLPLEYAICMRTGLPIGAIARQSRAEFDRKPIGHTIETPGYEQLFEPVRLAPSAGNSQPWFFVSENHVIHAYRRKLGFVQDKMYGRMNKIDMGIALCHAVLSLQQDGREVDVRQDTTAPAREGMVYTASIHLL